MEPRRDRCSFYVQNLTREHLDAADLGWKIILRVICWTINILSVFYLKTHFCKTSELKLRVILEVKSRVS